MSTNRLPKLLRKKAARYSLVVVLLLLIVGIYTVEMRLNGMDDARKPAGQPTDLSQDVQPNHQKVRATVFWVGEPPDADNANITNVASSWTGDWVKAFGGIDTYPKRCGYNPCGFSPKENAFYFALPYNDRDDNGNLKPASELKRIPWYSGPALEDQSLLKNRWIAVTHYDEKAAKNKTSYAQWEDVGPFNEDDIDYVFGNKGPKYKAGLDLSPAMDTYLNLQGEGTVSWRFVDASAVPDGPWKTTVTTSQLNYD